MKNLGYIMWIGAGVVLWFFMMNSFYGWWNAGGVIAGFILAPGVVLFPLLYWFKEGVFPVLYFIIWGIGIVGFFVTNTSSSENEPVGEFDIDFPKTPSSSENEPVGEFDIKWPETPSFPLVGPMEYIKNIFTSDTFESVPSGVKQADFIQKVYNENGEFCGIVAWKARDAKDWDASWAEDLNNYLRSINGHVAILISETLPTEGGGYNYIEGFRLGIFVSEPKSAVGLIFNLRRHLIKMTAINKLEQCDSVFPEFPPASELLP